MTDYENEFDRALKQAILLALLEKKYISLWQYEQCFMLEVEAQRKERI